MRTTLFLLILSLALPTFAGDRKAKKAKKTLAKSEKMWHEPSTRLMIEATMKDRYFSVFETYGPLSEMAFVDIDGDNQYEAVVRTTRAFAVIFGRDGNIIASDEGHWPQMEIFPESHLVAKRSSGPGYHNEYFMVDGSRRNGTYQESKVYGLDDAAGDVIEHYAFYPPNGDQDRETLSRAELTIRVNLHGTPLLLPDLNWQPY